MKRLFGILFVFLFSAQVFAQEPDWDLILSNLDMRSSFEETDFSATMNMLSEDPEDGITKNVMTMFRRDAEDKFLMLTLEPENRKGQGTLRVGDNMWIYDPDSRKFSHTSLKESVNGTDARNSDFRKSSVSDDYSVAGYTEGRLGSFNVWIVELEAIHNEVTYPYETMYIDQKSQLMLKSEDYSLSKRLLRTSLFPSYAKVGESYMATKMIFIDEVVEGKKTQITINDISIETLPDSVFQKAYLERVNQ